MGEFQSAVRKRESDPTKRSGCGETQHYHLSADSIEPGGSEYELATSTFAFNRHDDTPRSYSNRRDCEKSARSPRSLRVVDLEIEAGYDFV